jgi:hypothetical protein
VDPIGFDAADPHFYRYVWNNPSSLRDASGLDWNVRRRYDSRYAVARSTAPQTDTIASLANKIGLDSSQWEHWLSLRPLRRFGHPLPATYLVSTRVLATPLAEFQPINRIGLPATVYVPNTVLALWAGNLGAAGKVGVFWRSNVGDLRRKGFHVDLKESDLLQVGRRWKKDDFYSYIRETTQSGSLHGVYFWGHGNENGISLLGFQSVVNDLEYFGIIKPLMAIGVRRPRTIFIKDDYNADYPGWSNNQSYKLALGIILACESENARPLFTDNAIFEGRCGLLVPSPVDSNIVLRLLAGRKQGTNP